MRIIKIGNVVFEDELVNHNEVEYVNYYNNEIDFDSIKELPTLYVGWKFVNKQNFIKENNVLLDISKKEIIKNKLYWEFSFSENKTSHVNGVESFIRKLPYYYFNERYVYVCLDPIFYQIKNIDSFNEILCDEYSYAYLYKNDMIYCLKGYHIFGVDLNMYDFFKMKKNDIKEILFKKIKTVFSDNDGEEFIKYKKIFPDFLELKRYLVVILSK